MTTLRKQFHELGNWHNKMMLASTVTRDCIQETDVTQLNEEELKKFSQDCLKTLNNIERYVVGADELVTSIKSFLYKKIDPEEEMGGE